MKKLIPIALIILAIVLLAGCTENKGIGDNEKATYTGEIYDVIYKAKSFLEKEKTTILFTDGYSINIVSSQNNSITVAGVYAYCKDRINQNVRITYDGLGNIYNIKETL